MPGFDVTSWFGVCAPAGTPKPVLDKVHADVTAALSAMECIVIQDIFHNETARFAHVFLPGSSFLEKDGTFTNAERRISRVRKIIEPLAGLADWEATLGLSNALGYPMNYTHPSQIMDEIAAHWHWLGRDGRLVERGRAQAESWLKQAIKERYGREGLKRLGTLSLAPDTAPFGLLAKAD